MQQVACSSLINLSMIFVDSDEMLFIGAADLSSPSMINKLYLLFIKLLKFIMCLASSSI
jgi:hypothetical protein